MVLCDGLIAPQEADRLRDLYPLAAIIALPRSRALEARLQSLRFSVDELRGLYVSLRRGTRPDRTDPRAEAMARVLQSMGLIGPDMQLLPPRKTDPNNDPLYRMIQGGKG